LDEFAAPLPDGASSPELAAPAPAFPASAGTSWATLAVVGGGALLVGVLIVLAVFLAR
jgi:hypothetical protein